MRIILTVLFFAGLPLITLKAQKKYERKLTMSEWIKEMVECKEKNYILENAEVVFDFEKDSIYKLYQDSLSRKDTISCYC